jgi:RNA polymerase sigma-54 factor
LAAFVEAELDRNPLLERAEPEAPEGRDVGPPETATPAVETWQEPGSTPDAADLEQTFGTPVSEVFQDEMPEPARHADLGALPLSPSPWSVGGARDEDDAFDAAAALSAETGLHDHLLAQLDLATRDPANGSSGAI